MLGINREEYWPPQELSLDEFIKQYNQLFQEATDLFAEFDPCKIHNHTCVRGQGGKGSSFCCDGCQYLTDEGCTTSSIWCKLWTCSSSVENQPTEFWAKKSELDHRAAELCHGGVGRYGLETYITRFYSEEEYETWKTTEDSITEPSSMSAS